MPVRVLHLLKAIRIAGAERHLLLLLPALRDCGVETNVLLLEDPGQPQNLFRAHLEDGGSTVRTLPIHGHLDLRLPIALHEVLSQESFDILHAHLPHGEVYGEAALRSFPSRPFVITRHNDDRFRRWLPFQWVFAASLRRAGRVIAISNSIRRFLIEVEKVSPEKIETIPYGLDADAFAHSAHPGGFRRSSGMQDTPLVGFIGRLNRQKGVDILLRAFALVELRHPTARLVLAGDGPDRVRLARTAKSLGLRRVDFLGWRNDAVDILADIDLLVMPSRWEGFGMVALEAMALSKPVVASRVSALPEIIVPGETGRLVEPDRPEELAEAVLSILSDPARAAEMGRAGRRRALSEFPVERMARHTAEVYRALADPAAGRKE
jgi:glycosyltransferase involved in cell wall biosynthesis